METITAISMPTQERVAASNTQNAMLIATENVKRNTPVLSCFTAIHQLAWMFASA
jgi:hypothetical protein